MLWPFGGGLRYPTCCWCVPGSLLSEVIFRILLILNWHVIQALWETKTNPSTSHPVRFIQPWYGSATCKENVSFFSLLLRCTGRSWDVDGPAVFPKTFLHHTPNYVGTFRAHKRQCDHQKEECSETEWKAPGITIFRLTEASWITIYSVTSLGSRGGVEKWNELWVMKYLIERLARPLVGGEI